MKSLWKIGLAITAMVVLLSGCGGRIVIDRGGIGKERDVMITEAAENTARMEERAGFSE